MPTAEELREGEQLRRWIQLAQLCSCAFSLTLAFFSFQISGELLRTATLAVAVLFGLLMYGHLSTRCDAYYVPLLDRAVHIEFQRYKALERNSMRVSEIDHTGLVKCGDVCRCYKSFSASYRGFPFTWSDLYYHTHVGFTSRFDRTRFRGIWLTVDRPVTFKHPVLALRRGYGNRRRLFAAGEKVREVQLADPAFNEIFKVFSSDEQWTAWLLDPELCQKLMLLQELCEGKLLVGFIGNQVHIACARRTRGTHAPIFGDIEAFLAQFYEEQIDWTRTVIDTLWPARGA